MEPLRLNLSDICHHVVTFGMDVYPQVEIPEVRTRLNMFYEEAKERLGLLFDQLIASDSEFRISKSLRKTREVSGPSFTVDTFVLTNRGPVCVFPLVLPEPVGETGVEATYLDDFDRLRGLFFAHIPERVIMRIGLIRDLIFNTGQTSCEHLLTQQDSFGNAGLVGGQVCFKYRDSKYNHSIVVEPVSLTKTTQLPVGAMIDEPAGYGVRVRLDVNNSDVHRPLQEDDIRGVVERATSLWPDKLLEYLHERSQS